MALRVYETVVEVGVEGGAHAVDEQRCACQTCVFEGGPVLPSRD